MARLPLCRCLLYGAVVLLCLLRGPASFCSADDIDVLYSRLLQQVWPSASSLPGVISASRSFLSRLNSSCYWPDVDYEDQSRDVWKTAEHMSRLVTMTQALTFPSSPLLNDSSLSTAIHCALHVWTSRDFLNPNWWWPTIGIPLDASSILLMLGSGRINRSEIDAINRLTFRSDWWNDDWGGGANLVWEIQVQLYRSVPVRNVTGLQQGFERMWQDVVLQPLELEGIQADYSYHFHGQQLLTGAYGAAWTADILLFSLCAANTSFDLDEAQRTVFADFLTQGNAWMSVGRVWDFGTIGRGLDRPGAAAPGLGFDSAAVRAFAASVPSHAERLLQYADRMDGRPGSAPLVGDRHFFTSDFHVHRAAGWIASLRLHSVRTIATECDNGENLKGEHLADGLLSLYAHDAQLSDGSEYDAIFPLWDWQTMNGVTAEWGVPLLPCGPSTGDEFLMRKTAFVGGISDGSAGSAAMDTATHNLTAHRVWFFFPSLIVACGANITDATPAAVRTTLQSRLLPHDSPVHVGYANGSVASLHDGNHTFPHAAISWIYANGVGYILLSNQTVGASVGNVSGNYLSIGPYDMPVTRRMVTSWIEHGRHVSAASFCYAVVANITVNAMTEWKRKSTEDVSCVENHAHLQAVSYPSLSRASVVVWPASNGTGQTAWIYQCKQPSSAWSVMLSGEMSGLYQFSETSDSFTVTVSHPTLAGRAVTVLVGRAGTGANCSRHGELTSVDVVLPDKELLGKSVSVSCSKVQAADAAHATLS